jgi:hypothetical protein
MMQSAAVSVSLRLLKKYVDCLRTLTGRESSGQRPDAAAFSRSAFRFKISQYTRLSIAEPDQPSKIYSKTHSQHCLFPSLPLWI